MPTPQLVKLGITTVEELSALAALFGFQVREQLPKEDVPHWEGNRVVSSTGEILYEDKEPQEYYPPERNDYALGMPSGNRNAQRSLRRQF